MRFPAVFGLLSVSAVIACGQSAGYPVASQTNATPPPRTDASMAYDPATRDIVMFGGTDRSGALNQTWTWDGASWHQEVPTNSPPPRQEAILTFDPSSNRLILFGGVTCGPFQPSDLIGCGDADNILGDTWAWDGKTWSRLDTRHSPQVDHFGPARVNAATDQAHGQIILVAHGPGDRNDRVQTWSFAHGDWQRLNPAHVPHLWDFSGPQFDPASGRLIVQEGPLPHFDCGTGACTNDFQMGMWAWDGSDWQMFTGETPPSRDTLLQTAHGLMLLGVDGEYVWNGFRWDAGQSLPWGDTLRDGWTGAYDAARQTLVVYGGQLFETNHLYGDLLGWHGGGWKTLAAAPPSPSPSALPACDTTGGPWDSYGVGPKGASIALDEPLSGPCHLKVTIRFALTAPSGQVLPVTGNPSTVTLDRDLTYDTGTIEVTFDVSGACRMPPGTTATVSLGEWHSSSPANEIYCEGSPPPVAVTFSVRTIPN